MNTHKLQLISLSLMLALAGCGKTGTDGKADAGKADAGKTDAGKADAGKADAGEDGGGEDAGAPTPAAAAPVPFSLALTAAEVTGFPGLHSGAGAMHDGLIVLMAGRRNGLHAFPPERQAKQIQSFPLTTANETIYVIDPATSQLRGEASIAKLPAPIAAQLRATNTEYTSVDGWLYVVGGYAYSGQSMKTLDVVTAIDLAALVEAIDAGTALDKSFADQHIVQASHLALAITGGEIHPFAGHFLLVFGNQFEGLYTPGESVAVQTYSSSVRVFDFAVDSASGTPKLTVNFAGSNPAVGTVQDSESPYHRRDGTVQPAIDVDGNQRLAAYGGVFKGGRMEGFTTPIYIDADSTAQYGFALNEDTGATQLLSQYKCATLQAYDAAGSVMYTTLFGGISQFYWDPATRSLKRDTVDIEQGIDGLPFIDSISTLRLSKGDSGTVTAQYLLEEQSFPPADAQPKCGEQAATRLGAETVFFAAPDVPRYDNGVLRLDQISAPTVVGYLVGGIASTAPYSANGTTCASSLIYTVTLDPTTPSKTVELSAP